MPIFSASQVLEFAIREARLGDEVIHVRTHERTHRRTHKDA